MDARQPVDAAYRLVFWLSVCFTVAITLAIVALVVGDGRRRPGVVAATASEGATEIRARARKWSWEFEYPEGDRVPGELSLEVGRRYTLILSSEDVLHCFHSPELGLKRDVVPGQVSAVQLTPTRTGVFSVEDCATRHAGMFATVRVLGPEAYRQAMKPCVEACRDPEICGTAAWGRKLFDKNGCPTCHGAGGSGQVAGARSPGPRLVGIYGQTAETTTGPVTVDAQYLRTAIVDPQDRVVVGYPNLQMPAFALKPQQLDAIVVYLGGLK